jgi:DNA replication protein DnaC
MRLFEIPERFQDAVITTDSTDKWHLINHAVTTKYLKGFGDYARIGKAPLYVGTSGTGKSHSAAAICNRIRAYEKENHEPARDILWAPVGFTFHYMTVLQDQRAPVWFELEKRLRNADLVVFDDFGHLGRYERLRELFWIYVNARYDSLLPTIFTLNMKLSPDWSEMDKVFGEDFRRRIQALSEGLVANT